MAEEILLEDALRNMTITLSSRHNDTDYINYVGALQEFLVKKGFPEPSYKFNQNYTDSTFDSTVSYEGPHTATGNGHNKKEAKQAAAKLLLDKIKSNVSTLKNNKSFFSDEIKQERINSDSEPDDIVPRMEKKIVDNFISNPIGLLQEWCVERGLAHPKYKLESQNGVDHDKTFAITCVVEQNFSVGSGKTKKSAKHNAALNMLERLKTTKKNIVFH